MKFLAILLLATTATGCVHSWDAVRDEVTFDKGVEKPPVSVVRSKDYPSKFFVTNQTDAMLYVSYKDSAVEINGESFRVVSGETFIRNSDRDSSDTPVAPGSDAAIQFFKQSAAASEKKKPKKLKNEFDKYAPEDLTFHIAIRTSGNDKPTFVHVDRIIVNDSDFETDNGSQLKADEIASQKYGDNAKARHKRTTLKYLAH